MPRRRSTKARKSSGRLRPLNRADDKITKWNKASDIPMDEEDLFHASRDKVLLEGDNEWQQDDNDNEDEVFALNGVEDDTEEENEDENMSFEDEVDEAEDVGGMMSATKKGKKEKKKKKKGDMSEEDSESEQDESWGKSKTVWYSSNAAQLESDDEEGNELEEQEAKRLQSKMREEMDDEDFGLDDAVDIEVVNDNDVLAEPTMTQQLPRDRKLLIRHLEKTSPETLALARDWEDAVETLSRTSEKIKRIEAENPDALSLGMLHMYYQASLTYTTTLAFYLHLASSEKYSRHPELLKAHPILCRLLTLKQSLVTLEDLDFAASDSEGESEEDEDEHQDASMTYEDIMLDGNALWSEKEDLRLQDDELDLLLKDQREAELRASGALEPPKKKRRTTKAATKPINASPIFDLVEPKFVSSKASSSRNLHDSSVTDAYGEATSLQRADAADKSARKKSLRFHTSKIESASARRKGARSQALGGDDDIPYRERKKERDSRLARENVKNRGQGGEDLNDHEPEARTEMKGRDDNEDVGDADGYYELVKKQAKSKKEQKKAEYEAMVEAARPDFDEDAATGPRSLTRAILANKGLTPHRPKSVRNPRVKKRLQFEKAKKKLSSQKAIYKGGLAESGRYDGEKSGISKVIKSIRLG
ncbi:hypothetical protein C0993_003659 [Termitomyces sp. T159_Od127]|nr:hypothetical protein C0993_003659 [Termitomyces sp. T159_Od127]